MKNYRAVFNTETHKGIKYDFTAKSFGYAIKFANIKFEPHVQGSLRLYEEGKEVPYAYNPHWRMEARRLARLGKFDWKDLS